MQAMWRERPTRRRRASVCAARSGLQDNAAAEMAAADFDCATRKNSHASAALCRAPMTSLPQRAVAANVHRHLFCFDCRHAAIFAIAAAFVQCRRRYFVIFAFHIEPLFFSLYYAPFSASGAAARAMPIFARSIVTRTAA
jgi:hypothetical protein